MKEAAVRGKQPVITHREPTEVAELPRWQFAPRGARPQNPQDALETPAGSARGRPPRGCRLNGVTVSVGAGRPAGARVSLTLKRARQPEAPSPRSTGFQTAAPPPSKDRGKSTLQWIAVSCALSILRETAHCGAGCQFPAGDARGYRAMSAAGVRTCRLGRLQSRIHNIPQGRTG
jgi:hypothetical protein